jgi:hypothetical protein
VGEEEGVRDGRVVVGDFDGVFVNGANVVGVNVVGAFDAPIVAAHMIRSVSGHPA